MFVIDVIAQAVVFLTGITSLYLVGSKLREQRMKAGLVGLAGEPFWITTALLNGQPFIALLALMYAWNWWRVYKNNCP